MTAIVELKSDGNSLRPNSEKNLLFAIHYSEFQFLEKDSLYIYKYSTLIPSKSPQNPQQTLT